jgi:hypothetical protein
MLCLPAPNRRAFVLQRTQDMPGAEAVASALLQLKGNPTLFEKWRERAAQMYKANGKMFGNSYQLTTDET